MSLLQYKIIDETAVSSHSPDKAEPSAQSVERIARASGIRNRQRRSGFDCEQARPRNKRLGSGRKNRRGRAPVRTADAEATVRQRISRHCSGLAGMGTENCGRAVRSTGQAPTISDLAETN